MNLFIVRHGIAEELAPGHTATDYDRPLSDEGWEKTRLAAAGFVRLGLHVDVIGTSPLRRTRQTAGIFQEALGLEADPEPLAFMRPGAVSLEAFASWLNGKAKEGTDSVLLVGHMPDVSSLVNTCLPAEDPRYVIFKKAAVAHITFQPPFTPGGGRFVRYYPPAFLRDRA